jgi:hypothetical protein
MALAITHHKVEDYDAWRPVYDADKGARESAGIKDAGVYRSLQDPNDLYILMEVSDVAAFQKFGESPELRQKMQEGGVIGQPEFALVERAE